jgi:iron complex outermembrane receptor protein
MKVRTLVWLIALVSAATQAFAQSNASIQGVILDPSSKGIGNATVLVRSGAGRVVATLTTTPDGHFTVADLAPGLYDIDVTATGFSNALREGQRLAAGKTLEISITLTVAPFSEEVTVSSTLPDEIRTAPSQGSLSSRMPESVVSDAYIRNYTAPQSDYAQIVSMTPGSYTVASNGPGLGDTKVSFRAFSDKQLTIMFDGIPFNDTNDPSHHSWVFFPAPFTGGAQFDRSPGTAASIGPATFGGTIGLQSRILSRQPAVTGSLSYGSFNTQLYDVDYNSGQLGSSGKTSFIVDAHHMASDGYQTYNSQRRDAFMGKVRYNAASWLQLSGFTSVIDVFSHTPNQKGPTRGQVAQFGDNFLMTNDPASPLYYGYNFYHVPTDFEYFGARGDLGHGWTYDDKVYTYRYYNHQQFNGLTTVNATSATDKLNSYRKYGNLLPITQVSSRGALRTGLWSELANSNRYQTPSDPRTWVDAALPNFHETFDTTTLQPYVEYQMKVVGNLSITPGVKLSYYKLDFRQFADNGKTVGNLGGAPFVDHNVTYHSWQPAFDAHYLLRNNWSVYAQYATGSSIPPTNVFDVKNAAVLATPKPIETTAYQTGTTWKSRRFTVDADFYDIRFDNDYASQTDPITGEPVYYFTGTQKTKGIEAESNIAVWQGVSVYLNGTAGTAKYSSNNLWAAGVPSDTESIGLTYANRNWNAGLFSKRVGRTYNDNGSVNQASPNDPFNMTNVFVNYTLGNQGRFDRTKLKLSLNNLFDSHAITSYTPGSKTTNDPGPNDVLTMLAGRSVSFTVTIGYSR